MIIFYFIIYFYFFYNLLLNRGLSIYSIKRFNNLFKYPIFKKGDDRRKTLE